MDRRRRTPILTLCLHLAVTTQLVAQFQQYTPGGGVLEEGTPSQESFDDAIQEARWRLGPFYLDPWIGIRDATYSEDFLGTGNGPSDFTVTAGAGLRSYLPLGDNAVFSLHALPEYVWWQSETDRNRLNGRYGAGLFVYTNRFTLDVTGTLAERQQFFSSQIQQLTHQRNLRYAAALEIRIKGSLHLFGAASQMELENLSDHPGSGLFDQLDREETVLRGGIRLKFLDRVSLGFGVEDSQVRFADAAVDRDNSGSAPVLEIRYDGNYFNAHLDLAQRQLEPDDGSAFAPFDELTGDLEIDLAPESRLVTTLYATRNVVYALGSDFSHFEDEKAGVRLSLRFGRFGGLRLFGETGKNAYVPLAAGTIERSDDVAAFGAALSFDLGRWVGFNAGVTRTDYDSNLPQFDRDITTFTLGLGLHLTSGSIGWPP